MTCTTLRNFQNGLDIVVQIVNQFHVDKWSYSKFLRSAKHLKQIGTQIATISKFNPANVPLTLLCSNFILHDHSWLLNVGYWSFSCSCLNCTTSLFFKSSSPWIKTFKLSIASSKRCIFECATRPEAVLTVEGAEHWPESLLLSSLNSSSSESSLFVAFGLEGGLNSEFPTAARGSGVASDGSYSVDRNTYSLGTSNVRLPSGQCTSSLPFGLCFLTEEVGPICKMDVGKRGKLPTSCVHQEWGA